MKTCSKCNIQIDDSKKFCTKCGSPLVSGQKVDADIAVSKKQINVPASADNITRDKKPSNSKTIIGIVATAILLVTVSAIFLYMQINRNKASFASKTTEAPPRSDITSTATEEEVKNLEKVHLSYKLSADLSRVHANVYRIQSMTALGQDKQEIANLSAEQLAIMNADIALVKSTLDSFLTPEEKKYYQTIMDNLLEYQTMSSRVIKLASVGTGAVYMASADEKFQTLDKGLTQLCNYYKNPSIGFDGIKLSYKLSADLSRVHANVYRIQSMTALGQDKQEIANLSEQQLATITADIALVKSTLDSSLTPEEKRYYQPIMDNLLEYQTMSSRVIKLASVGTGAVYMASADEKFQTLDKGLTQLNNYYKNPRR